MGQEKEMLPGRKGRKGAPPLPHQGGQRQPPTVAQYESIIRHLQKANDTMAHEVMSGHMHALSIGGTVRILVQWMVSQTAIFGPS